MIEPSKIQFVEEPAPEEQTKIWGTTRLVVRKQNFEIHELRVEAGGYCSRHRHRKRNRFHLMSGELVVELFTTKTEEKPYLDRILRPGDFFEVSSHIWHRFRATRISHVLECYWIDIDPDDIERADVGGKISADNDNTELKILPRQNEPETGQEPAATEPPTPKPERTKIMPVRASLSQIRSLPKLPAPKPERTPPPAEA